MLIECIPHAFQNLDLEWRWALKRSTDSSSPGKCSRNIVKSHSASMRSGFHNTGKSHFPFFRINLYDNMITSSYENQ